MGPFLLFFVLLAGGAAYYEYSWEHQSSSGFQNQIQDWQNELGQLKKKNTSLAAEKERLGNQMEDARAHALALMNARSAATSAPAQAAPPPPNLPPPTGNAPLEDIGTFTTLTGKTYENATLMKIEANDIVISYAGGITQVPYAAMPPDLQKRFGWDPQKTQTVDAATLRYQQQLEAAKEAAAGAATPAPAPSPTVVPNAEPVSPANP